jgi:restriction endonuclease Mrr
MKHQPCTLILDTLSCICTVEAASVGVFVRTSSGITACQSIPGRADGYICRATGHELTALRCQAVSIAGDATVCQQDVAGAE